MGSVIAFFIIIGVISSIWAYHSDRTKKIEELSYTVDEQKRKLLLYRPLDEERKQLRQEKENTLAQLASQRIQLEEKEHTINEWLEVSKSNITSLPYFAGVIADFETRELDILAKQLDWGDNQARKKKVKSLVEIKAATKALLAQYKEAEYQLAYAIKMFPALDDFLATDFAQLPSCDSLSLLEDSHDNVRNYLSKEEYSRLSNIERNQLALDRYFESHRKSNWQIGRDYEQYVGFRYTQKGYAVEYYGSLKGLEDLGRDLIAIKDSQHLIIQCKFWSSKKQIHEKHINQLYGTMVAYSFENNLPLQNVRGVFVTNITLTSTAKRFAGYLGIEVVESYPLGKYPCIKCNINHTTGEKIYHLPFDQQYDSTKVDAPGEFFATTVAEAEQSGFRRAFRWHST